MSCTRWAKGRTMRQSVTNKEYYEKKSFKYRFVFFYAAVAFDARIVFG